MVLCNKINLQVVDSVVVAMGMEAAIHEAKQRVRQTLVVVVVAVTMVVPMDLLAVLVLWFYQVRLPILKDPIVSPSTLAQAKPRLVAQFPTSPT